MDWRFLQGLGKVPDQYGDEAFVVLRQRTEEGAKRRFCRLNDRVKNCLDNEFEMIRATNTAKLFLYWADTVALIKQRTYPYICSVQNCSLVSYCLGITEVNPLSASSYFERLLNRQSAHVPILFIEVPKGRREELWERYLVNDDFVENWLQSPFFRTLLEDPAIVRGCLLSHPLIIKLIELNPGLDSIIQKDENIRMVTETLLHHRQIFAPEARIAIISQLEKELGHSLQLGPEHVSYLFMYSPDRFYPEHLKTT